MKTPEQTAAEVYRTLSGLPQKLSGGRIRELMAQAIAADRAERDPSVEILHHRDPDSSCELEVFVNGSPFTDTTVEDIDPGAGYSRADWDARREGLDAYSPAFRTAVLRALSDASDSPYITDEEAS